MDTVPEHDPTSFTTPTAASRSSYENSVCRMSWHIRSSFTQQLLQQVKGIMVRIGYPLPFLPYLMVTPEDHCKNDIFVPLEF